MVSILKSRQGGVKFAEAGNVKKSYGGIRRTKKADYYDKENGTEAFSLAKGRSDIYTKLRKQIEELETDTHEAQRKIEELELEEEKLLLGSHRRLIEMDQKFSTVEERLKDQIVRLQADFHMQLAEKNDELMLKDKEIEELKAKVKNVNDRLTAAAKTLGSW